MNDLFQELTTLFECEIDVLKEDFNKMLESLSSSPTPVEQVLNLHTVSNYSIPSAQLDDPFHGWNQTTENAYSELYLSSRNIKKEQTNDISTKEVTTEQKLQPTDETTTTTTGDISQSEPTNMEVDSPNQTVPQSLSTDKSLLANPVSCEVRKVSGQKWGVVLLQPVQSKQFIMEYLGSVVSSKEVSTV